MGRFEVREEAGVVDDDLSEREALAVARERSAETSDHVVVVRVGRRKRRLVAVFDSGRYARPVKPRG